MHIVQESKKILLNLREPERVTSIIPRSRLVNIKGHDIVAVEHGLDEARVLRNIGIMAPSPIRYYYDWQGQHKPFSHQVDTSEFLTLNPRAFCTNDMGTGKTLSVLWAFDWLRSMGIVKRMLVVSPLSTLERTWGDEVFRNFPHLTFAVLHGTPAKRQALLEADHDIYIINHDGIKDKNLLAALTRKEGLDVVVPDELAEFRNTQTERWKALNKLIERKTWVWGLTGTPIPKAPTDAFAQIKLIRPQSMRARYFSEFRDLVMRPMGTYKWVAKEDALQVVHGLMQPNIRFARDECIDLPPTTYVERTVPLSTEQAKAYKEMLNVFKTEYAGGQITAVNAAVKANKLLQICCIGYNTPVLTERGWVPIQGVRVGDRLWDGVEWVGHAGVLRMGCKRVIERGGVRMTPDHMVLTTHGWKPAQEVKHGDAGSGFDRQEVRLPDGDASWPPVFYRASDMGLPLRLWFRGDEGEPKSALQAPAEPKALRVPPRGAHSYPRDVSVSTLRNLDKHEASVHRRQRQGLAQVWRSWHRSVRSLAGVVRQFLGRYGAWVRPESDAWAHSKQRAVLAGELQMGDTRAAGRKPTHQPSAEYPQGATNALRSGQSVRVTGDNAGGQTGSLRLAIGPGAEYAYEETFDILDCGPRHRFVVLGRNGERTIVHNCGTAYSSDGDVVIPAKERVEAVREIIGEAGGKVIVFVPFTGALKAVADALAEDFTVEVVHGETSKSQRDRIFGDFQTAKDPKVLVANPGTMSHGLTLTAANTVIWYAPIHNAGTYEQANARVTRPGQKRNTLIVGIEGSPLERGMYDKLSKRIDAQDTLLNMFKD